MSESGGVRVVRVKCRARFWERAGELTRRRGEVRVGQGGRVSLAAWLGGYALLARTLCDGSANRGGETEVEAARSAVSARARPLLPFNASLTHLQLPSSLSLDSPGPKSVPVCL